MALPPDALADLVRVDTCTTPNNGSIPVGFQSLTKTWVNEAAARLTTGLRALDVAFPGRIVGVLPQSPGYPLHLNEWFLPGPLTPSLPPDAVSDYSDAILREWCATEAQRNGRSGLQEPPHHKSTHAPLGNCAVPSAAQRNNATAGNFFLTWPRGDPDHPAGLSARFNRFVSERVAAAIEGLAVAAKEVSDGALLTMFFYGCASHDHVLPETHTVLPGL